MKEGGFRNGTYNVLLPKVTFESVRTVCLYSWSEEKRNVGNIDRLSVRGGTQLQIQEWSTMLYEVPEGNEYSVVRNGWS